MSRHEAQQLEFCFNNEDLAVFILANDPVLDLIGEAQKSLKNLHELSKNDSYRALTEIEHLQITASRVKAVADLEKTIKTLKINQMRYLGVIWQKAIKAKEGK